MAELEKVITTQEELDEVIKDRVTRAKESAAKKYEGWISPEDSKKAMADLQKQVEDLQKAVADAEKTIKAKDETIAEGAKYKTDLDKTRIAIAAGLDVKYASRLQGENAEAWKKDAEELAKDFSTARRTAPIGNPEPQGGGENKLNGAFRSLAKSLNNKGD